MYNSFIAWISNNNLYLDHWQQQAHERAFHRVLQATCGTTVRPTQIVTLDLRRDNTQRKEGKKADSCYGRGDIWRNRAATCFHSSHIYSHTFYQKSPHENLLWGAFHWFVKNTSRFHCMAVFVALKGTCCTRRASSLNWISIKPPPNTRAGSESGVLGIRLAEPLQPAT